MARTFQIPLTHHPAVLLDRAKKVAHEHDAIFKGDETSGTFAGSGVEGNYEVAAEAITITITKKPFLAPWVLVESRIRDLFS